MALIRILIADDDLDVCQTLRQSLETMGWKVEAAHDGQVALKKLLAGRFDAVLLDLNMPKLDGLGVLRKLKNANISTSVIVITGFGTIQVAVEATRLGAKAFLEKPVGGQACIDAICQVIEYKTLPPSAFVKRIDAHIQAASIQPELQKADVCAHFKISRSYLDQLLRDELHSTFRKRVAFWRITYAKYLLEETDDPVYLIADQCGFKNHRRLAETFRRLEGMSPTAYRKICSHRRTNKR